jgi:hypothetical protein
MGSSNSHKSKARGWVDANNNDFYLTSGRVNASCITFRVKRRRGAPALTFDIGERLFLSNSRNFYTAEVISFVPHSRCGSVVAASGILSLDHHEDIARALGISNINVNNESMHHIFYNA